jgi:hypothetical protein
MPFDGKKTTKVQVSGPAAMEHVKLGLSLMNRFQNLCDMRGQIVGSDTVAIPGGPTFTLYVNPAYNVLTVNMPIFHVQEEEEKKIVEKKVIPVAYALYNGAGERSYIMANLRTLMPYGDILETVTEKTPNWYNYCGSSDTRSVVLEDSWSDPVYVGYVYHGIIGGQDLYYHYYASLHRDITEHHNVITFSSDPANTREYVDTWLREFTNYMFVTTDNTTRPPPPPLPYDYSAPRSQHYRLTGTDVWLDDAIENDDGSRYMAAWMRTDYNDPYEWWIIRPNIVDYGDDPFFGTPRVDSIGSQIESYYIRSDGTDVLIAQDIITGAHEYPYTQHTGTYVNQLIYDSSDDEICARLYPDARYFAYELFDRATEKFSIGIFVSDEEHGNRVFNFNRFNEDAWMDDMGILGGEQQYNNGKLVFLPNLMEVINV